MCRDTPAELKEATEQYETEADRAMLAKDKMLRDLFKKIDQLEGAEADPKVMESVLKDYSGRGRILIARRQD